MKIVVNVRERCRSCLEIKKSSGHQDTIAVQDKGRRGRELGSAITDQLTRIVKRKCSTRPPERNLTLLTNKREAVSSTKFPQEDNAGKFRSFLGLLQECRSIVHRWLSKLLATADIIYVNIHGSDASLVGGWLVTSSSSYFPFETRNWGDVSKGVV